jgi:hypothetical protein
MFVLTRKRLSRRKVLLVTAVTFLLALAILLAVAIVIAIGLGTSTLGGPSGGDAADPTIGLDEASSAAFQFFRAHGTFMGLDPDRTGLARFGQPRLQFVSGRGSSDNLTVSVSYVRSWIILTQYDAGGSSDYDNGHRCWVILDLQSKNPTSIFGKSDAGEYHGVILNNPGGPDCEASRGLHVSVSEGSPNVP